MHINDTSTVPLYASIWVVKPLLASVTGAE